MTYVIIHALAPIFVIMLLGFWAGKAGMVDNKNVSLLNIFVMDFALPATLFSATVHKRRGPGSSPSRRWCWC